MKIIGHRGARGLAPENTIAGLKKALEHNVDEVEFDLRVSKDGVVLLHHDRDLTDPNGKRWRIAKHDYQELLEHKADLATFSQALDTLKSSVPMYIEIKPGEPIAPITDIINGCLQQGWRKDDFRLASFSLKTLEALHSALPDISLIVNENWSGVRAGHRARKLGAMRVSMNRRWLWSGFIRAAGRGNHQLTAFTVNDPRQASRWERAGLYGVVTDYPDRFEK